MSVRFSDLHCKEVICLRDGTRLGYVSDVQIELPEGRILAIVVPGPCRILGLMGRKEDYVISWDRICRIGPDLILADICPDECRVPRIRPECGSRRPL